MFCHFDDFTDVAKHYLNFDAEFVVEINRLSKIQVLLIEDNHLLREGIEAMLNGQPNIKALSAAGNGDAFEKAKRLKPHVVLLDLGLKNQNSLKVVGRLIESVRMTKREQDVIDLITLGHSNKEIARN
jgi:DNA-binding NarL/FixJ family response regulator